MNRHTAGLDRLGYGAPRRDSFHERIGVAAGALNGKGSKGGLFRLFGTEASSATLWELGRNSAKTMLHK